MQYLIKYIKKYWRLFTLAIFCLTLEALCDLTQPTIMSKIIDIGVAKADLSFVLKMGILMILVTGVGALAATGRNILASNVSQRFGAELRADLFKKIQSFSFQDLDKFEGASLITRLTNDVTQLQNVTNGMMRIFVKAPILCVGAIIMAIRLNARMAIILLAIVPIVAILIYFNIKIGYPYFSKVQKHLDKVNEVMREYLSGVRVVKAFNRFNFETERFEYANNQLSSISIKAMRIIAIFSPGISLTVNMGIVLVIWLGGFRVSNGTMQVGQIIAFINYMTQILFSLMIISNIFNMFVRARASVERVGEVFAVGNDKINIMEENLNTPNISPQSHDLNGDIVFEDVSFSYGNSAELVLKNIFFTCKKGETLGIIGSTGSGKSSLVNLIPRFYEVTDGKIFINNIELTQIDTTILRDRIAVVPQKSILFTGTIEDNLKWGKEDASEEEIVEACEIADAHGFVSNFKEGYLTKLGQGGVNVSGGQKQRISIARALIKKPDILILDDCTSAIDMVTEQKIRNGIKAYSKDLTAIIIAQRITSVMSADKILVIDNGELVGIGEHKDLLENCKVYQEIYSSQMGRGEVVTNG